MRDVVRDLALALRERVLPLLGSHAGRAHADELAAGKFGYGGVGDCAADQACACEQLPGVLLFEGDR